MRVPSCSTTSPASRLPALLLRMCLRHRMGIYLIKGAVAEQAAAALERERERERAREQERVKALCSQAGDTSPGLWEYSRLGVSGQGPGVLDKVAFPTPRRWGRILKGYCPQMEEDAGVRGEGSQGSLRTHSPWAAGLRDAAGREEVKTWAERGPGLSVFPLLTPKRSRDGRPHPVLGAEGGVLLP